jgi:hypothetical protein
VIYMKYSCKFVSCPLDYYPQTISCHLKIREIIDNGCTCIRHELNDKESDWLIE